MAMALGVTASAYAANPFSDVPAGHWAYDSISKLAASGVIEGYGIGANYTFAKNMVGTVVYYDTENKLDSKEDDQRLWADLTFTF